MHFQDSIKSTNEFHTATVTILTPPLLPQGKAAYRRKRPTQRRSLPSQCLMIICSRILIIAQRGLGPLTMYSEIKVVHQAFLGADKLIYSIVHLRVGGGADLDARLCQSVAQTEVICETS